MATNYVNGGNTLNYLASTDVKSSDVVIIGDLAGIAVNDTKANETGVLQITGVFQVPKGTSAINQGAKVYWSAEKNAATATATGNTLMGYAMESADANRNTLAVKLNR